MTSSWKSLPSDIVLFALGSSGSGKSQLINRILEEIRHPATTRMEVHQGVDPCTLSLCPVRLEPRSESQSHLRSVVIVDGPGWDQEEVVDQQHEIFANAWQWLLSHYTRPPPFGIIYVQDISSRFMIRPESALNLQASLDFAASFECQDITLVTTKWSEEWLKTPGDLEKVLQDRNPTWKKVTKAGLRVRHIEPGKEGKGGLAIIQSILAQSAWRQNHNRTLALLKTRLSLYEGRPELPPGRGRKGDIVILVMGPLKSGKSSFVNRILAELRQPECMQVSNGLGLTTGSIKSAVILSHQFQGAEGKRVILIDTPGFEVDDLGCASLLKRIDPWLKGRFRDGAPVGGVIYLHDITQTGDNRTADRIFKLFPLLVHGMSLRHMAVATTKWDTRFEDENLKREAQLLSGFWGELVEGGCLVRRLSSWGFEVDGPGARTHLTLLGEVIRLFADNV